MTLTYELKILDGKIKANQAQYDLGREAAKIPALSSNHLLEKYEYLTGEDLRHRPSTVEKAKFEYSSLGMLFGKAFEEDKAKSVTKSESDFNYDSIHKFYEFYKRHDEFEEMSPGSRYKKINDFNKRLIKFKKIKPKKPKVQLKKERIIKNVDELYEKYCSAYKSDYDIDNELNEAKKKKFDYKKFELLDKTDKKSKLDGETKKIFKEIENREKGVDKKKFMKYFIYEPTALVNKLLNQNTQYLRKILDEIKQQKIELNKDERNSTNNKNENDRPNTILSVIDKIDRFFEYKITKMGKSKKKKRFDVLKIKFKMQYIKIFFLVCSVFIIQ